MTVKVHSKGHLCNICSLLEHQQGWFGSITVGEFVGDSLILKVLTNPLCFFILGSYGKEGPQG